MHDVAMSTCARSLIACIGDLLSVSASSARFLDSLDTNSFLKFLGRKEILDGMLGANLICFQVGFLVL